MNENELILVEIAIFLFFCSGLLLLVIYTFIVCTRKFYGQPTEVYDSNKVSIEIDLDLMPPPYDEVTKPNQKFQSISSADDQLPTYDQVYTIASTSFGMKVLKCLVNKKWIPL